MSSGRRPLVMIVGAFPPSSNEVFGGMVTSCRALVRSSLPQVLDLDLLDSTQISNPPPGFFVRLVLAAHRLGTYLARIHRRRHDAVILFTALGASVVEKGAMAWIARLYGAKALMFPRGGMLIDKCRQSVGTRFWTRFLFSGARMVLCQGPAWQKFAVEVLGFSRENSPVIENWTATQELLAIGHAREGCAVEPSRLLFVGWLDRAKGVMELLSACRQIAATQRISLTFVGEGNMSQAARDYVSDEKMSEIVSFRGWLSAGELHDEYAKADIFVLPSWAEGLPNAMIEAMAAKLAIVVSSVGVVPDVIEHGSNGLLVAPRDVVGLRDALSNLVADIGLRDKLGQAAFESAWKRFGVDRAVAEIVAAVAAATSQEPRLSRSGPD